MIYLKKQFDIPLSNGRSINMMKNEIFENEEDQFTDKYPHITTHAQWVVTKMAVKLADNKMARMKDGEIHFNRSARNALAMARWECLDKIRQEIDTDIKLYPKQNAIFPPAVFETEIGDYDLSTPTEKGKYIHEYTISPTL